jgi:hypothetical protein
LVESKDAIKLRQKLQPMSDDSITLAREKFLSTLGTIDPYMIVAKRVDAPSFYVVHRTNGNVVLVTSGLWDPNELITEPGVPITAASTSLPGMELLAEAKESEVGDLSNSWLYQCLLEVACTAKRNGTKLRRLLKERQYATMEVNRSFPLDRRHRFRSTFRHWHYVSISLIFVARTCVFFLCLCVCVCVCVCCLRR